MRRNFSRPTRANLEWSTFSDVETNVSGASVKVLLVGLTSTVALDVTVLRVRSNLFIASDQNAASEHQVGAFGAIVVTDDAFAAGASAVPGPITDPGADWFVYQPFANANNFSTAVGFQTRSNTEYVIDSKAKRILEPQETIAMVIESTSDSDGFNTLHVGRILTAVRGTR